MKKFLIAVAVVAGLLVAFAAGVLVWQVEVLRAFMGAF